MPGLSALRLARSAGQVVGVSATDSSGAAVQLAFGTDNPNTDINTMFVLISGYLVRPKQ